MKTFEILPPPVFGIQTGVAISFFVKRQTPTHAVGPMRVFYSRRPEMETAEDKLAWLARQPLRSVAFDEIRPDKNANWVNLTDNDFETLLPLASKETKAAKTVAQERAIFKLFSNGINTARDSWVTDESPITLAEKVQFFIKNYESHSQETKSYDSEIK